MLAFTILIISSQAPRTASCASDRLLSVDPRLGQVQLAFQVITSWEDKSAKETTINTSRLLNLNTGPRVCVKPCDTIDNSQLCCEDIFTPAIHFANAVGVPTVNNKVLFGEDGTLSQISQVTGTFYQSFNLAYYPYSRFQVVIGLQLNAAQYSGPNLAAVLPVPYAINLQNRALGSGSEGCVVVAVISLFASSPLRHFASSPLRHFAPHSSFSVVPSSDGTYQILS